MRTDGDNNAGFPVDAECGKMFTGTSSKSDSGLSPRRVGFHGADPSALVGVCCVGSTRPACGPRRQPSGERGAVVQHAAADLDAADGFARRGQTFEGFRLLQSGQLRGGALVEGERVKAGGRWGGDEVSHATPPARERPAALGRQLERAGTDDERAATPAGAARCTHECNSAEADGGKDQVIEA